jgi:hypothetical protein
MENTLNNSFDYVKKWNEESNEKIIDDDKLKPLSNLLYYYGKEIEKYYSNYSGKLKNVDDIEQIKLELNILKTEKDNMKAALQKMGDAIDIISRLIN